MSSDPKVSSPGLVMPYDVPFQILSKKQMEWVQFKAKQKLLELKEEEEWKIYCNEQNCNLIEDYGASREDLLDANASAITNESAKENFISVSSVQIMSHKENLKGAKKFAMENLNKGQRIDCEPSSVVAVPHFQKTRLGSTVIFPESGKLNLLNLQKNNEDAINLGSFFENNKDGATGPAVQTSKRITRLPSLEHSELTKDLEEVRSYAKVKRNVEFTLPYALRQQHYLARKAYLPSFSKPKARCKKNLLPANESKVEMNFDRKSRETTASRSVNSKLQNLSSLQTKKLSQKEKMNTEPKEELLKERTKSASVKQKKINKVKEEVARKVAELVLNDILDEVIFKVQCEEEEKRKSSIFSQLNSILQKLNNIESEESAIRHKWGTLTATKLLQENVSTTLPPTAISNRMLKFPNAVQERSALSITDEIFRFLLEKYFLGKLQKIQKSTHKISTVKQLLQKANQVLGVLMLSMLMKTTLETEDTLLILI